MKDRQNCNTRNSKPLYPPISRLTSLARLACPLPEWNLIKRLSLLVLLCLVRCAALIPLDVDMTVMMTRESSNPAELILCRARITVGLGSRLGNAEIACFAFPTIIVLGGCSSPWCVRIRVESIKSF